MKSPYVAIDARSVGRNHTGDTTYWTGLIRGLAQLDSDLCYLLFSNAPAPPEIPENERFRWIVLPSHSARWWSLFRFPLTARRMGARVIHTQYNLSPLVTSGGITTIHDVSFYHEPSWFKPRDRVLLQRFVPASARRASKVFTVSEFSKREILKYIPGLDGRVVVTYNAGSDHVRAVPKDEAKSRIATELGLDVPYLLTVGTRWPRKNMNLALRAVDRLCDSLPHRLVVTGKAGWGDEDASPRAQITGFVSDDLLSALYSAADLYLAPALYEGFGITLLEAFHCGCPVIASANGAHEEVAGSAALIENTWQPAQWALAIENLLGDSSKLDEMRRAGFERAGRFTWRDSAQKAEQVYREVLA